MSKLKIRIQLIIILLIITPIGFWFKFHTGPSSNWFNEYGADVCCEIFWILFIFLIFPKKDLIKIIPIGVLIFTFFLELLQLWHPAFLERMRVTFLGKVLLGTHFVLWDFPHYILGCLIGWICLVFITRNN